MDWLQTLVATGGIGGFLSYVLLKLGNRYVSQMQQQQEKLIAAAEERENRLFDLARGQSQFIADTAVNLAQIADNLAHQRICPLTNHPGPVQDPERED